MSDARRTRSVGTTSCATTSSIFFARAHILPTTGAHRSEFSWLQMSQKLPICWSQGDEPRVCGGQMTTENRKVTGSTPVGATANPRDLRQMTLPAALGSGRRCNTGLFLSCK